MRLRSFKTYNSDIYWIANIELSKNPVHSAKLSGWLDMIGCLRNYSCAFLFLAIIESVRLWECIVHAQQNLPPHAIILTIVFTLLSVLLFSRFWVMYYAYYSKYIIRVYALENLESKEDDKERSPSKGVVYAAWDYDGMQ